MIKCIHRSLFIYFIVTLNFSHAFSQIILPDSSSQQNAKESAVALFYAMLGNQSPLYNGSDYHSYPPATQGNAYFLEKDDLTSGSVYYDGVKYTSIPLLYDLVNDQLITLLGEENLRFSLLKERVQSFDLLDHHFINISADTIKNKALIKSGFYEQLYKGKIQVLARRSKSLQTISGGAADFKTLYQSAKSFYLNKGGSYSKFGGQAQLLDLLKDKKKELEHYIRDFKLRFRDDPDAFMIRIAAYYDRLTN